MYCRRVWHPCHTHAPTELSVDISSHGIHFLAVKSPTDFTDLHRFLGCFQGVHLSQVHQQSKKCTNREGVPSARLVQLRQLHPLGVLPQNSQNPQNLLLRYSPTEFTEPTEPSAEKNSRRFHRFTQILLVRRFCVFCEFCGRITQSASV